MFRRILKRLARNIPRLARRFETTSAHNAAKSKLSAAASKPVSSTPTTTKPTKEAPKVEQKKPQLVYEMREGTAYPVLKTKEYWGPKGAEPTRHGDWERSGKCIDF
eukprot:TRINITY_DN10520_c0_g1_i1.p1 TRINITY_DN10520_c0_g1~~TRINITY_DN10520_c0_g1_i1.p1  ORF type:complete len:122 (-),score=16.61 TRINITY_DN10520_c0_g1_i1:222-539(-)